MLSILAITVLGYACRHVHAYKCIEEQIKLILALHFKLLALS